MKPVKVTPSRTKVTPVEIPRTNRGQTLRIMSSLPAGKFVPIARIPLLREDLCSGRLSLGFQMQETVEMLMNNVVIDVQAWLIPMSAAERFISYDDVNRAWEGVERTPGDGIIPYIETGVAGAVGEGVGENHIIHRLGRHTKATDTINLFDIEAYNLVWNHIAKNLSPNITPRARLAKDLAPGFWPHNMFNFIVPDFDEATMEGEVALTVAEGRLPVSGIGTTNGTYDYTATGGIREAGGQTVTYAKAKLSRFAGVNNDIAIQEDLNNAGFPAIYAELAENGITVSLANIELAKQTQAWANIRKQYNMLPEAFLTNLLMDGIQVNDLIWQQPVRLAHQQVNFGMAKRYASDGASLTESVVNGAAGIDISWATPKVNPGGVIMIFAQIAPEQLFERMEDPWLHAQSAQDLPHAMRDMLDPQKVEVVPNRYIDVDHDTPDDLFGYAPLNYRWNFNGPNIGGRFYRPEVDAGFDEDRQMLWAVETQNPALTEDFYLISNMHLKPFWTDLIDPFDVIGRGEAMISGLTQFGPMLIEKVEDDYNIILDQVQTERIEKP